MAVKLKGVMARTNPSSGRYSGWRLLLEGLRGQRGWRPAWRKAAPRPRYRVVIVEQAPGLEETGAGIQLSPNATRVLAELGLTGRLRPHAVAPAAIRIVKAATGRDIARIPLGAEAEERYGAPYWVIHRADLQDVLATAIAVLTMGCVILALASYLAYPAGNSSL